MLFEIIPIIPPKSYRLLWSSIKCRELIIICEFILFRSYMNV